MSTTEASQDDENAGCKLRLDKIIRNLKLDLEVWNHCHASGWPIVHNISRLYGKSLTMTKNMQVYKSSVRMRNDLRRLQRVRGELNSINARLVRLVDRLLDALEHTRESLLELRQLCCSPDLVHHIFYRNWQLRDLLDFVEGIMRLYDAEYEIKEMVAEELTKCKDHEELRFIRHAWREPRHALTKEFTSMFMEFNFETVDIQVEKSSSTLS